MSVLINYSGLGAAILAATGCGTLMHPERRHQQHNNRLDWRVVALNGLGLLLFFIPGVIAFAVDFYTGAIYLPAGHGHASTGGGPTSRPQESSQASASLAFDFEMPVMITPFGPPQSSVTKFGLRKITISPDEMRLQTIEQIVSAHVGHSVSLDENSRVSELSQIEDFDAQMRQHQSNHRFGQSLRTLLRV
ncbi:MAG TPA: hypothetical protein DDZ51_30980 [Planctomycetaceae bacterium]|nr:hypothetical protein [Planctomycetaceae bacterium]